jgi:hypothetical protein
VSRDLYRKCCDGGSITNDELEQGIKDYQEAIESLRKLGSAFEITRKVLLVTLHHLQDMQYARKQ